MTMSQSATFKKLTRISILQLVIIAMTVAALAHSLQERSFILGQALAWAISLPLQLVVLVAALDLSPTYIFRAILMQCALLFPALLLGMTWADSGYLGSLP